MHQSYLKSPLPVKLTWCKMQKSFFISEKIKKYRKCPALQWHLFSTANTLQICNAQDGIIYKKIFAKFDFTLHKTWDVDIDGIFLTGIDVFKINDIVDAR